MVSSTPVLDLPQELIIRISSYLTTIELGAFRRSCKGIEKYMFHSFAEEFFTKRQFMIEHESLDGLVAIAHHSSLARTLREVIFDVRIFAPVRSQNRMRLMHSRHHSGCLPITQFFYTGKALATLVDIFSTLPSLRTVGIRDFSGHGRHRDNQSVPYHQWFGAEWNPYGWSHGGEKRHEAVNISPITYDILPLILLALAKSNSNLDKLEVLLHGRYKLGRNAFIVEDDPKVFHVLDNLKTVMLSLGPKDDEEAGLSETSPNQDELATTLYFLPIIRFLHRLGSVEHLRLNFVADLSFGATVLDWLAGKQIAIDCVQPIPTKFERLTTLELGSVIVEYKILVQILISFKLRSFALWRICLAANPESKVDVYDDGDNLWPQFLAELSNQLPKTSTIDKILIGHAGQLLLRRRRYSIRETELAGITWFPITGRSADSLANDRKIEYDKQKSEKDVHGWLATVSTLSQLFTYDHEHSDEESFDFDDEDDEFDEDDDDDGSANIDWLESLITGDAGVF